MTRPKADSDPWITDPIARDRVVASTVVHGLREVISLLRVIRDELAETRALRAENRELREEIQDLWRASRGRGETVTVDRDYEECGLAGCSAPSGHLGNHRGSLRAAR